MRVRLVPLFLACATIWSPAQCVQDHRENKKAGIVLTDLSISGPTTLTSDEVAGITGELTGSCFNEDSDEMGERIRKLFQNRGYFAAGVKSVHLKTADPLGVPKPVSMETEVAEGPRYKVGEITFLQNHAFGADRLRQEFPLKTGDWFERDKIASGLDGLRKLYGSQGFLDVTFVPETDPGSNATMQLKLLFEEGPQYHLDKLEILAKKDLASKLRREWKLEEGAVFDRSYIDQYVEANRDFLPQGFDRKDVQVVRNCPEALVDVKLVIDPAEEGSRAAAKDIPCETKDNPAK